MAIDVQNVDMTALTLIIIERFCHNLASWRLQTFKNSPQCVCDEGYKQVKGGLSCEDINECQVENGGCDELCINSPGMQS